MELTYKEFVQILSVTSTNETLTLLKHQMITKITKVDM
jgi:hypothetical protein